jgi:hypothetical protein
LAVFLLATTENLGVAGRGQNNTRDSENILKKQQQKQAAKKQQEQQKNTIPVSQKTLYFDTGVQRDYWMAY